MQTDIETQRYTDHSAWHNNSDASFDREPAASVYVAFLLSTVRGPMFCFSAVLDPGIGHTVDVISPFISVLCYSDRLFHGESEDQCEAVTHRVVCPGHQEVSRCRSICPVQRKDDPVVKNSKN